MSQTPPDNIIPFDGCSDGIEPKPAIPYQSVSVKEFSTRPPPKWIIRKILPRAETAMLFGESGSGKTFLGFAMGMAIAIGEDWEGYKTEAGKVLYICAEGAGGFRNRIHAYAKRHAVDLDKIANFRVIAGAPNFLLEADRKKLIASLIQHGAADVIFIDTFARVTSGANENSGEEMGPAITFCQHIHALTGALVVLIHHSGKDATKGARGWSGIRAAMDAEIEVVKTDGIHKARISKQKDGEDGIEWAFNLVQIEIGEEYGEPITSCYYESTAIPLRKKPRKELKGLKKTVMDIFNEVTNYESNSFVIEDVLCTFVTGKMAAFGDGERNTNKQQFRKALNDLVADKLLQIDNGKVSKSKS